MRAAIYCRVSTEEQAERYGLSSQLTELRALTVRKGYTVPEGAEFLDDGYSGADLDRPALNRLRQGLRAKAFQIILVHDPDRLARKLAHQLLLMEEIERAGVEIEFLTVSKDATPEGRLLLQVKGVIAEYEREKIRERTSRGRKEKARRGLVVAGPCPYGYRPDPANSGKLIIHEDEAETVRRIYRWLVEEGRSIRSIVTELRRLGIPSRRSPVWGKSSVRNILTNSLYAGQAYYNRRERTESPKTGKRGTGRRFRAESEWIPIAVPAIVPPELFEHVRGQLIRNRGTLTGRPPIRFYLLRGLLRCGRCGRKLIGIPSHGRRVYRCVGRDRLVAPDRCRARTESAEKLESLVWETVVGVLRKPKILEEKIRDHQTRLGVREVELRSEVEHLGRQLADLERQEERLLDLYLTEGVGVDRVRARLEGLARQRAGIKERLAQAERQAAASTAEEGRQEAIRRYCSQALRGLGRLAPEGRRRLLGALVDEVVVREGEVELHGVLPGRVPPPVARYRSEQQDVVGASRCDLEAALGVRVPAHVGEVDLVEVPGRRAAARGSRRRDLTLAVEVFHRVMQRGDGDGTDARDHARLGGIGGGHEQRGEALAARVQGDREHAPHRPDAPVERELAHHERAVQAPGLHEPGGAEDAHRHRQVEGRTFLAELRRGEVHGDAVDRELEPHVADRGPYPVTALADGGVGQAHGGEGRQPRGHVHLDEDGGGLDPGQRRGAHAREHGPSVGIPPGPVNVSERIPGRVSAR